MHVYPFIRISLQNDKKSKPKATVIQKQMHIANDAFCSAFQSTIASHQLFSR